MRSSAKRAKTYGEKKFWLHQQTSSLVGAYVGAWGSVLSPPMGLMARTEAVLAPAVYHGLRPAVTVTQGNLTSGLDVLSTTFSRHGPAIGLNRPKTTFPPKGTILPSSSPAACSQCSPVAGAADPAAPQGAGAGRWRSWKLTRQKKKKILFHRVSKATCPTLQ